ncbi:MAG: hypothetical protein IKU52_08030 [Clostridia bacterium]|nr:hypothetical protein [Clostridia bacterium]
MKNKLFCLLLSILMIIPVFVACTQDNTPHGDGTGPSIHVDTLPPETQPPEPTEPERIEIEDGPSVIYYTEYDNRVERTGTVKELLTVDPTGATVYSWYVSAALKEAVQLLCKHYELTEEEATERINNDALQIYIAEDLEIQTIMDEYFANIANFPGMYNYTTPEAAMVITDPQTGDILGIMGRRSPKVDNETICYATEGKRSPGSSIKPVAVYGPALEYGVINYNSIYYDSPFSGTWPKNYPEGYRGNTLLHDALCRSVNTVAVKVLNDLTLDKSYEFIHDKLDMTSIIYSETTETGRVVSDMNLGSIALGGLTYGLTVRELTGAYQIFVNEGKFSGTRTVVKILDRYGEELIDNTREAEYVISPENASIMTVMLENVVKNGTAKSITLDEKVAVAGKTGTTSWFHDRWFVGYTPYYVGGVWFGYIPRQNIDDYIGDGPYANNIWEGVMEKIHEAKVFTDPNYKKEFTMHEGVLYTTICRESGEIASENCYNTAQGYYAAYTIPDTEQCSIHGVKQTEE